MTSSAKEVFLSDYTAPAFLVDTVHLDFDIQDKETRVKSRLSLRRNPKSKDAKADLILHGEEQKLLSVWLDGEKLTPKDYKLTHETLTISGLGKAAVLEIESQNDPAKNTALSGLYAAGPMLCTQCEPEGFRRITYYPDRPDVLAKFSTTIHADKKRYPILLSNGNRLKSGSEGKGRHYVMWEDPFPKPCYLFALVAGKLDVVKDHFLTKSGRDVAIEIYVEPGHKKETGFALDAIKKAMAWDEKTYGLEYDLDLFMIVAVSFFNFGAMENKGLNIFNDSCVLGRAETATDPTIAFIERVVGHEYFHNFTGDRVTCRDWFQLSLKEGLTVFREQEFCGDMNGVDLERLATVGIMRRSQFSEDAGAMAHPIRPPSYQAIDNFYTSTVYQKGSEVVRMIQTLVGRKGFNKGLSLYLKRMDGQAATCEDFVKAMEDANKIDLKSFMLWYSQAGTPVLDVTSHYNEKTGDYTLRVKQTCPPTPKQPTKKPMHMPFSVGLLNEKGKDLCGTFILDLFKPEEEFVFKNVGAKPVPSLLRNFSAPVHVNYAYTDEELLFLMAHDTDSFSRWDAAQKLFMKYLLALIEKPSKSKEILPAAFVQALRTVMHDSKMEDGTKAMMMSLPTESEIGLALRGKGKKIDPVAVSLARDAVIATLAKGLSRDLWDLSSAISESLSERASDGKARGSRRLKNMCFAYLSKTETEEAEGAAAEMVATSKNMTDKIAGLGILADGKGLLRQPLLDLFDVTFGDQPLIMDHWLSVQAASSRKTVLQEVRRLMSHPAFDIKNPNRVSALLGAFVGNARGFHAEDGKGYAFIGSMIAKLDKINPHAASRLAKPFLRWRDYDTKRQKLMKAELQKLAAIKTLSPNVKEIVNKSL